MSSVSGSCLDPGAHRPVRGIPSSPSLSVAAHPGSLQIQEQMCTFQQTLQGQMNTLVARMASMHSSVAAASSHVPEQPPASLSAPPGLGTPVLKARDQPLHAPHIEERPLAQRLLPMAVQEFAAHLFPPVTPPGLLGSHLGGYLSSAYFVGLTGFTLRPFRGVFSSIVWACVCGHCTLHAPCG